MFRLFHTLFRFICMHGATAAQQRSLLQTISMAGRSRMLMSEAISALANEERGYHANRLERLANHLRDGESLSVAIEREWRVLPDSSRSILQYGLESGELESAARQAIENIDLSRADDSPRIGDSLIGFIILCFLTILIIAFLMVKIVPTFRAIFDDFSIEISAPMRIAIDISNLFATLLPFLIIAIIAAILWVLFGNPARFLRSTFLGEIAGRFFGLDASNLLWQMAVTREAGKPLTGALTSLARCHHNPHTRKRLLRTWDATERGANAWQSLTDEGLITQNELRTILAAENLENTPWVLRQLADLRRTKAASRRRVWKQLLPVFTMLPIALVTTFIATAFIASLTNLISAFN